MSHHTFTTPRVIYLGQAYSGRDDREPRDAPRLPRSTDRPASERVMAHRAAAPVQAGAR